MWATIGGSKPIFFVVWQEDFTVSFKECAAPKVGEGCQFDSLEQEEDRLSLVLSTVMLLSEYLECFLKL